jgi:hypothetical protein
VNSIRGGPTLWVIWGAKRTTYCPKSTYLHGLGGRDRPKALSNRHMFTSPSPHRRPGNACTCSPHSPKGMAILQAQAKLDGIRSPSLFSSSRASHIRSGDPTARAGDPRDAWAQSLAIPRPDAFALLAHSQEKAIQGIHARSRSVLDRIPVPCAPCG